MSNFFLKMIQNLRQNEEIMLYGNLLNISEADSVEVTTFLENEFRQESFSYPYEIPPFDEKAALWSAKTVYNAAQLILYRENNEADLAMLLPKYPDNFTPAALLSADLCFRFLPNMLVQLKLIDPEDKLIEVLENLLHQGHYSGINYPLDFEKCDFTQIAKNKCLMQLYCNRIVDNKNLALAKHPIFKDWIQANLGIYAQEFWNDLIINE